MAARTGFLSWRDQSPPKQTTFSMFVLDPGNLARMIVALDGARLRHKQLAQISRWKFKLQLRSFMCASLAVN